MLWYENLDCSKNIHHDNNWVAFLLHSAHWGLSEMTDVLQATFPNAFQRKCILVENLLKGIPKGPNDNKSTSPQVMVCDKTVQMSVRWYSNRAQHGKEMYLARWSLRDTYRGVRFINWLIIGSGNGSFGAQPFSEPVLID